MIDSRDAMPLTSSQRRAIAFVEASSNGRRDEARRSLERSLRAASVSTPLVDLDACLDLVRRRARLTMSFHPDRLGPDGASVVEGLLREGEYRSQFETGLSNGSLTAFAGGARDGWEHKLFGAAYHEPPCAPHERPKYGGLDLWSHPDGACPRFGSCFFVLREDVGARATLTWGDSHLGPTHVGTLATLEVLLAPLFETLVATGEVLGRSALDVPGLLAAWSEPLASGATPAPLGRALDAYIEAQIHGPVRLAEDVHTLVIDASFADTEVGNALRMLAEIHGFALVVRASLSLALDAWNVPDAFRGAAMRPLAEHVVRAFGTNDRLDAAAIGRAAVSRVRDPAAWEGRPNAEETLQQLKQLWHVLVAFGRSG